MKLRLRLGVTTVAVTVPMLVALVALDSQSRHHAAEEALARIAFAHMLESGARERCEATPASWSGKPLPPRPGQPPPRPGQPPPRPEQPPRLRGDPGRALGERGPPPPPWPAASGSEPPPWPTTPGSEPPRGPGRPGMAPVLFAYDEHLVSRNPSAPALDRSLVEAIEGHDVAAPPFSWGFWTGTTVEILVRMPWSTGPCAFVLSRGTTGPGWLGAILPASGVWMTPIAAALIAVLLAVGPVVRRIRQLTYAVRRSATAGFTTTVTVGGRDEIAELGRAFDAAAREVRTQLAEKDRREKALRDFLANTTHDVMIPLTVLQAHLSTLQERASGGEPFDMAVLVSAMDEAHYLASLMHNLAIAAKLDAGEPDVQRGAVDLNALVTRVLGRHRPIARQLEISIESAIPELPVFTEADVTLLEQAISNLVYNAIRHNRPQGHVAVILEHAEPERFRLRILDDGPGIPAAELSSLVERGFRGEAARTRDPEGQGLGLHIAYRVAALHNLALSFQPSEYGGLQVDLAGARSAGG